MLAIASWAPFMVALRLWTGSVWPAVIAHGALNSIRVFLTQSIAVNSGINWTSEIIAAVLWVVAGIALYRVAVRRRASTQHPQLVHTR